MTEKQSKAGVTVPQTGISESGSESKNGTARRTTSTLDFWRREFGRPEPVQARDLVLLPLAISATAGLIAGVWSAAHRHFLDPAFIGYTIAVNMGVQVVILLLVLALAFITRRRAWSGVLFAIGLFCLLAIPGLIKIFLPGVVVWLAWIIALLGALLITRTANRHRHSRLAPWMIALSALVALCALSYGRVREHSQSSALPNPPNSPNVLIVIVDTLRADHLSPYGYTRDTSPYVNQLAQQGVLFENAISPSSWTLPAHASMLTGLYPHESGVGEDQSTLSGKWPNLGGVMRKRGYRTAAISANAQLFSRDRGFIHGFSHFEEYEQTFAGILEKVPLSHFILETISDWTVGEELAYFGVKNAPSAEKIDQDALNWIDKGHRPFFLVLNYFDVHQPVLPPEPWLNTFTTNPDARKQSLYFPGECSWSEVSASCDPKLPQFLGTYDGAIRYVDESIKTLLAQLQQRGLLNNTIVVFTSDHGQEFGDHGIYGHGKSLYRQVIQIPLIFWKPGLVPAAVRVPTPVSTADIAATILDLTAPGENQAGKEALPGRSLAALWRSNEAAPDWPPPISELARLHWFTRNAPNYNAPIRSIVTPDWHYIRQEGKDLLFDWKADPDELHDLCAAQPAVCATLKTQLQKDEGTRQQAH
jgi:arylsulfatase A-like enzyme